MKRKEDTPARQRRRVYENNHKEERKENYKVWGTSVSRQYADEIDLFLAEHGFSKVELIAAGYEALKNLINTAK